MQPGAQHTGTRATASTRSAPRSKTRSSRRLWRLSNAGSSTASFSRVHFRQRSLLLSSKRPPGSSRLAPKRHGNWSGAGLPARPCPASIPAILSRTLGDWIRGKTIGLPRADVPNAPLIDAIAHAGGKPREFRCYRLAPTNEPLDLDQAEAVLFTSAMSYKKAIWTPRSDLLVMAIGEVTAGAMMGGGTLPAIVGDGSLEGTLAALNEHRGRIWIIR